MRIEAVETILARLPLPGPAWGDTIHHVTHIEILLADVRTDNGLVGTGFSYTSGVGGTALKALLDKALAPLVVGQEVSPRGLWHKCWHHVHDMGGGGVSTTALAALDIALWDLVAKEVRKPLVAVLGPCRERILAYASGINLNKPLDARFDGGGAGKSFELVKKELDELSGVGAERASIILANGPYRTFDQLTTLTDGAGHRFVTAAVLGTLRNKKAKGGGRLFNLDGATKIRTKP